MQPDVLSASIVLAVVGLAVYIIAEYAAHKNWRIPLMPLWWLWQRALSLSAVIWYGWRRRVT